MTYTQRGRLIRALWAVVALLALAAMAAIAAGDLVLATIVVLVMLVVQWLVRDADAQHARSWWICSR